MIAASQVSADTAVDQTDARNGNTSFRDRPVRGYSPFVLL
jgi:hypothetical protein